jgi:hypothetical protein
LTKSYKKVLILNPGVITRVRTARGEVVFAIHVLLKNSLVSFFLKRILVWTSAGLVSIKLATFVANVILIAKPAM